MKERELIRKYALKNAFEHGTAQINAVVGKIVAEAKLEKKKITSLMPAIREIVEEVNTMQRKEIEKEFHAVEGEIKLEKKERRDPLDLDLEPPIVVRSAPNPNGPFHLGNARVYILNDHYARLYDGQHFLRFDDTDPRTKKASLEAIDWIKEDLKWLDINIDETFYASDRLETYYEHMNKLLSLEQAYVCTCGAENFRKLKAQKQACPCRKQSSQESKQGFEAMLSGEHKEGKAVLVVKTDLSLEDPSLRDWIGARIIEAEHARTGKKYRVWPMYNFQSAVDDHELGITLIIRGQEHAQNEAKQRYMYDYLGWKYPKVVNVGRVKLEGTVLSTSKIAAGIREGSYIGWDDPRLGTIRALYKRGFFPKTLRKAIEEVGVKSSDTTISLENLYSINRKYLSEAERYPFIEDPVKLTVNYCPRLELEKNKKKITLAEGAQEFFVPKKALEGLNTGRVFRVKDAYNVRLIGKEGDSITAHFVGKDPIDVLLVHWATELIDLEVMMPDATKKKAFSDKTLTKSLEDVIHLEDFGFCRIDARARDKLALWYAHP